MACFVSRACFAHQSTNVSYETWLESRPRWRASSRGLASRTNPRTSRTRPGSSHVLDGVLRLEGLLRAPIHERLVRDLARVTSSMACFVSRACFAHQSTNVSYETWLE